MPNIIKLEPCELVESLLLPMRDWPEGVIYHHSVIQKNGNQGKIIDEIHRLGKRPTYPPYVNGMGYHILINRTGDVEVGTRWMEQLYGGHCNVVVPGKDHSYNHDSIGVCLAGNLEIQQPTDEQIIALTAVIRQLRIFQWRPHKDFKNTLCPGKNAPYELITNLTKET